jgi:hypothetical protein
MLVMPSVVFENRSTWPNGEIEIYVDGVKVGKVERNETFEAVVDPGTRSFRVRADHSSYSLPIERHLEKREALGFICAISGVFEKRVDLVLVFHHQPHDRFDEHEFVKSLAAEARPAAPVQAPASPVAAARGDVSPEDAPSSQGTDPYEG